VVQVTEVMRCVPLYLLEVMCCVRLCILEAVEGRLCLLEVPDVTRLVLLRMQEAVFARGAGGDVLRTALYAGGAGDGVLYVLCLLEVLEAVEVTEVMCCVLLVGGGGVDGGDGGDRGDVLCATLFAGCIGGGGGAGGDALCVGTLYAGGCEVLEISIVAVFVTLRLWSA